MGRNVKRSRTGYCMYLDGHEGTCIWRVVSPRLLVEWWDGDWEWDCLWDGVAEGTWRALCIACSVANTLNVRDVSSGATLAAERVRDKDMAARSIRTEWKLLLDGGACIIRGVACTIGVACVLVTVAFDRVDD